MALPSYDKATDCGKKYIRGSDKVRTKRYIGVSLLEGGNENEYELDDGCSHHQPHRYTGLRRDNMPGTETEVQLTGRSGTSNNSRALLLRLS